MLLGCYKCIVVLMSAKTEILKLLKAADIEVGGDRPQDIHVHDDGLYKDIFKRGTLALGDGYMDKKWDANNLDTFVYQSVQSDLRGRVFGVGILLHVIISKLFNLQSIKRAFQVAEHHYDDPDGVYPEMLDETMTYTCGYYGNGATTLNEAQNDKHDLVCRKLGLKEGDRVLDIGCGFGSFAKYAAENYGAHVTGVTISKGQLKVARERTEGLSVDYLFQDYREVKEDPFDHIVSIGMFEAVGGKNFREFMEVAKRLLKPNGLFLLHTIGALTTKKHGEPWYHKRIFKNGKLPSLAELSKSHEGLFLMEDIHNFGSDYDKTLMEWFVRFDDAWKSGRLPKYSERFYRMWKYYLLSCAGLFRARYVQLWQVVLSPNGVPGGYKSIR